MEKPSQSPRVHHHVRRPLGGVKITKSIKNNQVRTVSVGGLMEKKEEYPIEGEKALLRGEAGQVGQSPRLHRVRRPLRGVKIAKFIENNQVLTVSDGGLMENYPIEGEKPSCEAKTPRVHRIGRTLGGEESRKWKDSHRGHRGHQDLAGVNRVGRQPVGKKERRLAE
jgi:hypothetical protein